MLVLGKFNGGATRSKLSDVLGTTAKQYRQFTVWADAGNTGSVHLGPSTVAAAGTDAKLTLAAGQSVNLGPQGSDRPFVVDVERLYCVGSAASQVLYVIANVDDGR